MKIIFLLSLIILVFQEIRAKKEELFQTCPELKGSKFETVSSWLSMKKPYKGSNFYIALKNGKNKDELLEISKENLSALTKDVFDVSLKTYLIIHGYRSNCRKSWVLDIKNKISAKGNVNIILVDWSKGSYYWNYIESVRATTKVARDLTELLKAMEVKLTSVENGSQSWNHLYIIGHSLGAHIAGQTGYLLKKEENFFNVDRITGLDPAWPCFSKADLNLKLDNSDADYVDVIHTQASRGDKQFALGLREPIGHVDYYVNGGIMQPSCKSDALVFDEFTDMFCSHRMAYRYFIELLNDTKSCQFEGHPWDQSYADAIRILKEVEENKPCENCVELGADLSKNVGNSATYLVLTSTESPYCSLKKGDVEKIKDKLELLKPPKTQSTLWNLLFDSGKQR